MNRIAFQGLYFLAWIWYFLLCRLLFHVYHYPKSSELDFSELAGTFIYGARLDSSFAAYASVIPFILVALSCFWPSQLLRSTVKWYSFLVVGFVSFLQAADLELYNAWGFRLDATPMQYIATPTEVAASVASAPFVLLSLIWALLLALGFWLFFRVTRQFKAGERVRLHWAPVAIFAIAVLILPMRGGWQHIPINQSMVYFSDRQYTNHAGINVPWNLMYSLLKSDYDNKNPFNYLPDEEAKSRVAALFPDLPGEATLVNENSRPNVLLIILESYTAKYVGAISRQQGVTPNIDSIAAGGLLFTNIYSSGDRSEKGMASILSGYPAQPTTSVMKSPRKTHNLPYLSKTFREAGYRTSYYYGGELGFANMKTYLLNGGFHKFTEKADFDSRHYNSKWGVHDHVLLERVLKELNQEKQPFFSTVFTLSSHEPYEIPVKATFEGTSEEVQFRNSIHYTDQAIGDFMRSARKQPWWDNTLVVLIADHGHRFPNQYENYSPDKFHIPLIFTGGALKQKGVIEKTGAQTDLAHMLTKHLGLPYASFIWGKDLLNPNCPEHAFYVFNNGFGYVTPSGSFAFDNISKAVIIKNGSVTDQDINNGQALMQQSFQDFAER